MSIMNIVHFERMVYMNTVVTSKDDILKSCRKIISEHGITSLNMRSVAKECGIALGSLYNYFPSKDDLVIAAIESVWQNIFQVDGLCDSARPLPPFPEYVELIFKSARNGTCEYPHFFTAHSISIAGSGKNKAVETMNRCFAHIKMNMTKSLSQDGSVRKDAFDKELSRDSFVDFVLTNILTMLVMGNKDCDVLIAVIHKTVY